MQLLYTVCEINGSNLSVYSNKNRFISLSSFPQVGTLFTQFNIQFVFVFFYIAMKEVTISEFVIFWKLCYFVIDECSIEKFTEERVIKCVWVCLLVFFGNFTWKLIQNLMYIFLHFSSKYLFMPENGAIDFIFLKFGDIFGMSQVLYHINWLFRWFRF